MELAGTTDLRAHAVLPLALRVLGRRQTEPALRDAVAKLRAWRRAGGLRRDHDRNGVYEHADAIRILDAWWPRWVRAQFEPALGRPALERLLAAVHPDNEPNNGGQHLGSAYQDGWYGYVRKDLRTVLGLARARALLARVLRRRVAEALPAGAARLAAGGAVGAGERGLRRRSEVPDRRPVVLRRRVVPGRRRRHAAADPLDQPPDLPAGERDPGTGAAVAVLASAGWKLSTRISWSIASCGVPSVVTVEK